MKRRNGGLQEAIRKITRYNFSKMVNDKKLRLPSANKYTVREGKSLITDGNRNW